MNLLNRQNWNQDECAYVVRLSPETRRFAWFCRDAGCRSWVVQIMDNEGNQIGDADYYANKGAFPDWVLNEKV